MKLHAFLLASACLSGLLSAPVGALPVEYAPAPPVELGTDAEFDAAAPELALQGLESRLLSAQAEAALTVSELRTRALAHGVGAGGTPEGPSRGKTDAVAAGRAPRQVTSDPLLLAVSHLVPANDRPARRGPGADGATEPGSAAQGFEHGDRDAQLAEDEELSARLAELRGQVADAVLSVVEPEVGGDGRASFSVAGLGGFRFERTGADSALMFRDVTLASSARTSARPVQSSDGFRPQGQASGSGDREARAALLHGLILAWDFFTHPIVLGLLVMGAIFRLLLGLGARRAAF